MLDVRAMRWIDRRVGNVAGPLAATATRWGRTRRQRRARHRPRKVLVMKFFGMGSLVLAAPALAALREVHPEAELHVVTFPANREVLELLGLADRTWCIDPSSLTAFVRSTLRLARALRRERIDLAIDLELSAAFPVLLATAAGIPCTAGFDLTGHGWRHDLLDVAGTYNPYVHTSMIYLSLVYLLATADPYYLDFDAFADRFPYPRIEPSEQARDAVTAILEAKSIGGRPVVVVNPNSSPELAPEVRKWPARRYADLATRLLAEEQDQAVVFIGTAAEAGYVEGIVAAAGDPRIVSTAGDLTLAELLALFDRAALVVSNDSGPMHLACLVDAPVVGLFFGDTPLLYAPRGSHTASVAPRLYAIPFYNVHSAKVVGAELDNTASTTVSVDEVLDRCREVRAAAGAVAAGR